MARYRTFFAVMAFLVVAFAGMVSAWGQSPWDAEQKAVIKSFTTQYQAIQNDDMALIKSVALPIVHISGKPIKLERMFDFYMERAQEQPADAREAFNPDRIVSITIKGDVAEMDLRDTKTDEIQHFTFQRVGGVWMWATLD